jgi:hypothetical protein
MGGTPVAQTRGMTDKAHLAACRRMGLVIDEDFEAGISPAQRACRTAALALVAMLLGGAAAELVVPSRRPVVSSGAPTPVPHQSGARPHSAPTRPVGVPATRMRANV